MSFVSRSSALMSPQANRTTLAWRPRSHERNRGYGSKPRPTIKITSCAGHSNTFPLSPGQNHYNHHAQYGHEDEHRHCITCDRHHRLLRLYQSQSDFLASVLEGSNGSAQLVDRIPARGEATPGRNPPTGPRKMAYMDPYSSLWNHQNRLFDEIGVLRAQVADTERQLSRAQHLLGAQDTKRNDRRKAKWTVTTNQRHIRDLNRELQVLMQSLLLCQAHIGRMHTDGSLGVMAYNNPMTGYLGQSAEPQSWDFAVPPPNVYVPTVQRPLSPDSGFSEPALYAQPFDLDLTADTSAHVYSHELQRPLPAPVAAAETPASTSDDASLDPTANDFSPSPLKPRPSAALSPSTPEFVPSTPDFSPSTPELSPATPVSPMSFLTFNETWTPTVVPYFFDPVTIAMSPTTQQANDPSQPKKRYSEAAIDLIESRLRRQKRFPMGRTAKKAEKSGDSVQEIGIEIALEETGTVRKMLGETEALVWPGSA